MKKIKAIYWTFFSVFTLFTLLFTILSSKDNMASIFLGGVALMVSSLALGLSDQKKVRFNGTVQIWSKLNTSVQSNLNSPYRVSMKIINNSDEPIYDVVYRLRLPNKISSRIEEKNQSAREYKHGYSLIIIDDSYGFLDIKGEDGFIPIDFEMQLQDWLKGNIFVTISGSNISPTTFKLTPKQKIDLINATQDKMFQLTEIK